MTSRSATRLVTHSLFAILTLSPAVFLSGCALAAPSAPSPSAPTRTTDAFDGSFAYQGSSAHQFTVTDAGLVEVRLTAVGPLTTMGLGVSVSSWDGSVCGGTIVKNDNARPNTTALSGTTAAGDYCLSVYDSGNVPSTWTATYSVTVTHP